MELSRNTVRLLVSLMALSVGGLLYLQYTLLRSNVGLKEEAFGRNALTALNAAADRLEEIDIRDRFLTSVAGPGEQFMVRLRKHEPIRKPLPPLPGA